MFEIKEVNDVEATGLAWGLTVAQGALTAAGWWMIALAAC